MAASGSTTPLLQRTLAEIVTADARAAAVFDRLGLDYCCHGGQTLEEAAEIKGAPVAAVASEIEALGAPSAHDAAPGHWTELDALTQYIVTRHHGYVRETVPSIQAWLDKLVSRHGHHHPELQAVRATFENAAAELQTHMMKEEHILFPYIEALAAAARTGARPPASPFGTIANPIRMMEEDHHQAGDALEKLRELTNGYTVPADGCATYRLCYEALARFEVDLHRHVHLENHVLFPRAIELEQGH